MGKIWHLQKNASLPFEIIYHICSLCGDDDHRGTSCCKSPSLLRRVNWVHQRTRQGQIWANIRMIKYFLLHLFLISQCWPEQTLANIYTSSSLHVPTSLGKGSYQGESLGINAGDLVGVGTQVCGFRKKKKTITHSMILWQGQKICRWLDETLGARVEFPESTAAVPCVPRCDTSCVPRCPSFTPPTSDRVIADAGDLTTIRHRGPTPPTPPATATATTSSQPHVNPMSDRSDVEDLTTIHQRGPTTPLPPPRPTATATTTTSSQPYVRSEW